MVDGLKKTELSLTDIVVLVLCQNLQVHATIFKFMDMIRNEIEQFSRKKIPTAFQL